MPQDFESAQRLVVIRFVRGDRLAFERLYEQERGRLSSFILRYVRMTELAEDIFQETWILAWRKRAQLREPARFRSWLYQIARNACFHGLRKTNRTVELRIAGSIEDDEENPNLPADDSPNPRDAAQSAQWRSIFDREIQKLDIASQEIMVLRFGSDLTLREIAETMDIPIGTVATKLRRSLGRIRRSFDEQGVEYPL